MRVYIYIYKHLGALYDYGVIHTSANQGNLIYIIKQLGTNTYASGRWLISEDLRVLFTLHTQSYSAIMKSHFTA